MSRTENVELTVLCLITDGDRMLLQNNFAELMRVINDPALTEFQYLVDGETWTVSIK